MNHGAQTMPAQGNRCCSVAPPAPPTLDLQPLVKFKYATVFQLQHKVGEISRLPSRLVNVTEAVATNYRGKRTKEDKEGPAEG